MKGEMFVSKELVIRDTKKSPLNKEDHRHIDNIAIEQLKEFVIDSLEAHGNIEQLKKANKVADIITDLLVKKKLVNEHTHQSFVDVLISAAMLHNLFYKENDWTTVFHARRDLMPIAKKHKINEQVLEALFSTIEGQLGEDMPVKNCIPNPGTPTELFAYAVWFADYK